MVLAVAVVAGAAGQSQARPVAEMAALEPAGPSALQTHVAGQWTWRSGADEIADAASYGVYGTKGVPDAGNVPGARFRPVVFEGSNGVRYVFGGNGHSESGFGVLNDLWKWDGTRWAWLSGSKGPNQVANYGTKGVPASGNVPGARGGAVSWSDQDGNLWLFGGQGWGESGVGYLNDLWKWDGTHWTWVSGSSLPGQYGIYGTLGVGSPGNAPGARRYAVSWLDSVGNLWLFGGEGYSAGSQGWLNDLWKWDGSNWTWMSGSSSTAMGIYGTKGTPASANVPGGREGAVSWSDPAGNLWLFGGFGAASVGNLGHLNDLWRWDGTNWTWMSGSSVTNASPVYGSMGVPAPGNVPVGRQFAVSWRDAAGHLWLFGGYNAGPSPLGNLNDLWRWDGTNWTWMSGSSFANQFGTYGTKGVPGAGNSPGARHGGVSWLDANGDLVHFGGYGNAESSTAWLNDLWKWNGTTWTWTSGSKGTNEAGRYGTRGVPLGATHPGSRLGAVSWTDTSGNLWLFGGEWKSATGTAFLNDLWKWDGSSWTWMGGSSGFSASGTYGTKGIPAPENTPGGRMGATVWADAAGTAWLFGGEGYGENTFGIGNLNDLWRWDGSAWAWISGSTLPAQFGTYGAKGVAAASNVPGARSNSSSWLAPGGILWLFGGSGNGASSTGFLNDLWKWDGTNWTWVSGTSGVNQTGSYGTKGVAAAGNAPGSRSSAFEWRDAGGNLWLGGGFGYTVTGQRDLNDLWKWDGVNWTWVGGSNAGEQPGVYGTKGVAAASNVPGARVYALSWGDSAGNAWVFGGHGYAASAGNRGPLNDLWKWDGTNWTWLSGSNSVNPAGVYGTKGVSAPGNVPGGRQRAVSWRDAGGNLWLGTGFGSSASGQGNLDDLWKWDGTNWSWVSGTDAPVRKPRYGTKGTPSPSNEPGARRLAASWRDPAGNLWLFGGEGVGSNGSGWLNDLWKWDGTAWTWVNGASEVNQYGSYGSQGVADPGNVPGARYAAATWTDAAGNLWLFGGYGFFSINSGIFAINSGWLNDLWKWDGSSWTWVGGASEEGQLGSYGSQGVADPGNVPGGRYGATTWTDESENFWLFGGYGWASFDLGLLNDLWKWDGSAWTWMNGSDSPNQPGTYGTKGVSSEKNVPGARWFSTSIADADGDGWLFGGGGYGASAATNGSLNDLWRWDGQKWTWMSGSDAINDPGSYGSQGVPASGNTPGARYSAVSWSRPNGELWLFGGAGVFPSNSGDLRDLWQWDGKTWTWMDGSSVVNEAGFYGTKDLASAGTYPGSRSGAVSWTDVGGNLWLFGGLGFGSNGKSGMLDDLWVRAFTSCFEPSAVISTVPVVCVGSGGTQASVPDAGAGAAYSWSISGGSIVSGAGTRTITFNPAGGSSPVTLDVAVTASGGCRALGTATVGVSLTALPGNDGPVCAGGTIQLSVNFVAGASYSWTGPGGFSSNAMLPTLVNVNPSMAGNYFVTMTVGGCVSAPAATAVVVNPKPATPIITAPAAVGPNAIFTASVPVVAGVSYEWTVTNGTVTAGSGTREITVEAAATGLVSISVTGSDTTTGCVSAQASVSIAVGSPATRFYPVTPCRLFDTREAAGASAAAPALAAGETRILTVGTRCGLDAATVRSLSVNQTVTGPTAGGELVLYRGDLAEEPVTSNLAFGVGRTRANNAILELSREGDGTFRIRNRSAGSIHFILDVNGFFGEAE